MRGTVFVLGLTAVGAMVVAPAGLPQERSQVLAPRAVDDARLAEIGRKAEVMRRVLFIELRKALKPAVDAASEAAQASSRCRRSPVRHVDATYLPGYGVSFVVGMRPSRRPDESSDGNAQGSLWKQLEAEERAGLSLPESYVTSRAPTCDACDAQKSAYSVLTVADAIVRSVAAHGHRFSELQTDERLSVAIHLSDWSGGVLSHVSHSWQRQRTPERTAPASVPLTVPSGVRRSFDRVVPEPVREMEGNGYGPKHLLLTFTKRDLDRFQDGELDLVSLTNAVHVVHY